MEGRGYCLTNRYNREGRRGVLYLTSQEFVEGSNLKHECYYRDMASYVVFGQQILRTKGTVTFEHVELRLLCALCCVLCKFVCFYSCVIVLLTSL